MNLSISIRPYSADDEGEIVGLSLRAWDPVFASMERTLGREISVRLHGEDWRLHQRRSVREVLSDAAMRVRVGESAAGTVVGFVAATVRDPHRRPGEVVMLAVDPDASNQGVGTTLTEQATGWLRTQGMRVAVIDTGEDPGHAPARRTYAKAGYTAIPLARYFKAL